MQMNAENQSKDDFEYNEISPCYLKEQQYNMH